MMIARSSSSMFLLAAMFVLALLFVTPLRSRTKRTGRSVFDFGTLRRRAIFNARHERPPSRMVSHFCGTPGWTTATTARRRFPPRGLYPGCIYRRTRCSARLLIDRRLTPPALTLNAFRLRLAR